MAEAIKVVDLFAGPGGLGEGFSSFTDNTSGTRPFRIRVSAEMDPVAHQTLRLRAFYRLAKALGEVPESYYQYILGERGEPYDDKTEALWEEAGNEALCLTLGTEDGDRQIDERLTSLLTDGEPWVLIGGPPCQAYSLVGRARNRGIADYDPAKDSRHYLYKDYLRIIAKFRPTIFVMENVKGILSSRIKDDFIFHRILGDLVQPGKALANGQREDDPQYRLYSLVRGECFNADSEIEDFDTRQFIVRSEDFGIPQKRHRVFIVGVRADIGGRPARLTPQLDRVSCAKAIGDLAPLRSGLSREDDSFPAWRETVTEQGNRLVAQLGTCGEGAVAAVVTRALERLAERNDELPRRSRAYLNGQVNGSGPAMPEQLAAWFRDAKLETVANHETRGHIASDLGRYLFCAAYGEVHDVSPKAANFPSSLAPKHDNWSTGAFADRFRVQLAGQPSSTITSHISKDGHYFIHYDAAQCRSLTVREAARLQTFPDNYFFEGGRTQQYVQVGNAVPPYLARQIAEVVWRCLALTN